MYDRATVDAGTGSARGFCARSRHSMRSTGRRWRPNVPVQTHGIFGRRCKPCSRGMDRSTVPFPGHAVGDGSGRVADADRKGSGAPPGRERLSRPVRARSAAWGLGHHEATLHHDGLRSATGRPTDAVSAPEAVHQPALSAPMCVDVGGELGERHRPSCCPPASRQECRCGSSPSSCGH